MEENLKLLSKYRFNLSRQQFKTFRGQILAGDINAFRKGLAKVLERDINERLPNRKTNRAFDKAGHRR